MPHLSRVRFVSVGHPQARMEDLLLDLRGADGAPTDSTVWLRNGGGKSSILNLLFAIVRPSRREFLGGKADSRQRKLDDYVLPGDRAVTVAEWHLADGGRAVTGVFYEHRSSGAETGALRRLFFAARVDPEHPETSLEGLPIDVETAGGRARRTLKSFRQEWMKLGERASHVRATDSQREWQSVLEKLGIDAGVFSYQVRMNQREGGADEIFRFSSPEDFTDFLLELAVDPELGDKVGRNVSTFRQELIRRKRQLIPERALVAGLIERVSSLAALAGERSTLASEVTRSKGELAALEGWFQYELERVERSRDGAGAAMDQHLAAADRLDEESQEARAVAAALQRHAADLRSRELEEALTDARSALDGARVKARAGDALIPLRDARRFERRARELRGEVDDRRADNTPVRDQLQEASRRYAAALVHRAATLRAAAAEHTSEEGRAEAEARSLSARIADAREIAARAAERSKLLAERLAAAGVARGRVEETGALGPNEPVTAAVTRLETDIAERGDALRGTQPSLDALEDRQEALEHQLRAARASASEARSDVKVADAQLSRAAARRAALEQDAALLEALEVESLDLDRADAGALTALSGRVRRAQEIVLEIRLARAGDERAVAALEERGLLPPSPDVEALLDALRGQVEARSGWEHLAACAPPEERAVMVANAPAAARGIVVADDQYEAAAALLRERGVLPEEPVLLTDAAAFEAPGRGVVLGPSEAGWYDRDQARDALASRRARLAASDDRLARALSTSRALTALQERLTAFRGEHPQGWFAEREAELAALAIAAADAGERLEALGRERVELNLAAGEKRERIKALRRKRDKARRMLERVRAYAQDHDHKVASWRRELAEARSAPERNRVAVEGWREAAEAARSLAREAAERARGCDADARDASARLREIPELNGEVPEAGAGPVDALADRYRQLVRAYEDGVGADGLMQAARENEHHAQRARAALSRLLVGGVTEAAVSAALDALSDPADAERARQDWSARTSALEHKVGTLTQRQLQARQALSRAEAMARGVGAPSEAPPLPDAAETAERRAEELEAEAAFLDDEVSRLKEASRASVEARRAAEAALVALAADQRRSAALREAHAELLAAAAGAPSATPEHAADARARLEALEDTLAEVRVRSRALDKQRRSAAVSVRAWTSDAQFEGLDTALVQRFRSLSEAELEASAGAFTERLTLRSTHLDALVTDVDRHRSILVSQLLSLAEEGLSLLRAASNSSKLPDHLPGLGGAHFLKITTRAPADPAERRAIIARMVDDLADSESEARFPTGMELVQRAVRRLARPIQVKVLHPDPSSARRMVGIAEMARFSGGEQLTGAILLYCTLARLRARSRGLDQHDGSVLVLDNPVGRASRVRFLELQREVARAMGIQLVYTTGVNDHEALRTLPNIIRLRNERIDQNRGHRLVEPSVSLIASARVARPDPRLDVREETVHQASEGVVPLRVA